VCHPLSAEVFLFISGIYCKALSLGFRQFLGETLSISLQNLRVSLRWINIPELEYSDGWSRCGDAICNFLRDLYNVKSDVNL